MGGSTERVTVEIIVVARGKLPYDQHSVHHFQKSASTEELTAEMANLEGLMKDLNAITQQEFEC